VDYTSSGIGVNVKEVLDTDLACYQLPDDHAYKTAKQNEAFPRSQCDDIYHDWKVIPWGRNSGEVYNRCQVGIKQFWSVLRIRNKN
jgi:hypothetical protein